MNKEVLITVGLSALAFGVILLVRDNLPTGSFAFKKQA